MPETFGRSTPLLFRRMSTLTKRDCSATDTATAGVLVTVTSCRRAAVRSMLFVPVPQIDHSFMRGHEAKTRSVNVTDERMLMTAVTNPVDQRIFGAQQVVVIRHGTVRAKSLTRLALRHHSRLG